jgi:hypothetical protein
MFHSGRLKPFARTLDQAGKACQGQTRFRCKLVLAFSIIAEKAGAYLSGAPYGTCRLQPYFQILD